MSSRWPAILIVAVAVATPLLSTALFLYAPPSDTTNRGELLTPVALPAGFLPVTAGTTSTWHLLAIGTPDCDVACQQRLCLIHQVRLVHLGEKDRIGRLWLLTGAGTPPAHLTMEPGCGHQLPAAQVPLDPIDILTGVTVVPEDAALLAALPQDARGDRDGYLYLVDPNNRVIMRYPRGTPAQDIAKDLGRLLRLSRRA